MHGGLDVRVELPKRTRVDGFVPRPLTGFQVKKSDMTPAKIAQEMRPRGKLRLVIRELAERSGAYIIVSSKGSATDSALRKRQAAMLGAVRTLRKRMGARLSGTYSLGAAKTRKVDPGLAILRRLGLLRRRRECSLSLRRQTPLLHRKKSNWQWHYGC